MKPNETSGAERLDDALDRLEVITERVKAELEQLTDARIDWMLKTGDTFERAKAEKKSDAWAERVTARAHPVLWEALQRAENAVRASEKESQQLRSLIEGYRSQNANERTLTR